MTIPVGHKVFGLLRVEYVVAAAVAVAAALLQWLFLPLAGGQAPLLFFLLAVVCAAIFLGRGPAMLVLFVGVVDGALSAPPIGSLEIYSPQDLAAVLIFAAIGVLIVGYGTRLRFTTTRAALAEQRLALAQENTGVGIFELDFESNTAFVSPGLCRMLGREVTPGEVDLARWLGGLRADHVEESRRAMNDYIARGELRYEREQEIARPDGEIRWFLNRVELQTTAAGILRIARGVTIDITERKRIDELLHRAQSSLCEADRRKDEFLATLAHELRNPLAPIRQGVRVAAAAQSTDAQRRWSHAMIERQVQHMSLLLDDLLDVSRIGRGTLLLRKSDELLSVVLDTAVEAARPHLEAKRHRLEKSLPTKRVTLSIDPVRIAQVLGNLLTNAAKYTDPEGEIRVSAQREGPDFVIRVKDNGIGLTLEQQTEVFDMFSQVPAALEQSQGGLGIGLALARGLIELHGGSIRASSPGLGRGTEMIVSLPGSCIVREDDGGPDMVAASPVNVGIQAKRCILIAADNIDAADSLAELLRLEGFEVHVAYDGAEALATFARVDPDAALLDVGMPHVSGLEVVRAIRQQPKGQRATLIAVTGWGQDRDRRLALEAGFDHHLTKPTLPEVICDLLQRGRSS